MNGRLNGVWLSPETRDAVVDYVRGWSEKSEISKRRILKWLGVPQGTDYKWQKHFGKIYEHRGWIPRDHWLTDDERQAIVKFHLRLSLDAPSPSRFVS